jgi:2-polyprenyl-3-methyl-5-hydroxy-6-metoxy-1,4-benzoquinol methylase
VDQHDHLRTQVAVADKPFEIRFPRAEANAEDYDQDEEWCEVRIGRELRRFRFHDYDEIYSIPGLYEQLFYEELKCDSPRTVCALLAEHLEACGREPEELRVLDVGAGNGIVGEELKGMGAGTVVGVDIIEEAAEAAERDRPEVYDDYKVLDFTDMSEGDRRELVERQFNCLTTVAALGFGDIPPDAFAEAYNLVEPGGHIAFNIKEDFMDDRYNTGFSRLIRGALDDGTLELEADRHYRHRLSVAGDPLSYIAMVGEKRRDLPVKLA